jgi:high-affinity nickel permease
VTAVGSFLAATGGGGAAVSLLAAALTLGLRHGFDWDHVAAISDIAASNNPRRGFRFGTAYALGHAAVVLSLGAAAVLAGSRLPTSVDDAMGRVAGVTLLVLAAVVLASVIRDRGQFRAASRWVLLIGHVGSLARRLRRSRVPDNVVRHPHSHGAGDVQYTGKMSFGIGMAHGVGAETPTQLLVFLAASNAGGPGAGLAVLVVFVVGLVLSNSVVTLVAAQGFGLASARPVIQVSFALVTTALSVMLGLSLLFEVDFPLPSLPS